LATAEAEKGDLRR
jgi:hypothetical protein